MKRSNYTPQRFCFVSNTSHSYLIEYVNLFEGDVIKEFSFKNLNLTELKSYAPSIIVIDQYFVDKDYNSIINSIKINFKRAKIYFLSPEFANLNGDVQSSNNKNHFYSNFNEDILNQINSTRGNDKRSNFLEAG